MNRLMQVILTVCLALVSAAPGPVAAAAPAADGLLSACRLNGTVVLEPNGREYLRLDVKLEFRTVVDDTLVPIGFKGARLVRAAVDGEAPVWGPETDGYSVRIPKAKEYHQVELTMHVPLARSGGERRVIVERIPKSAITSMDWQMPMLMRRVSIPYNPFEPSDLIEMDLSEYVVKQSASAKGIGGLHVKTAEGSGSQITSEALGVIEHLDVTWTMGILGTELPPSLCVTGDITATMHERDRMVDSIAWLKVESRLGAVERLVFRFAPDATVSGVETEPKSAGLKWKFDGDKRLLTIQLPQTLRPNQPPLQIKVAWDQKYAAKPGSQVNAGQISLVEPRGAIETGVITVWSRQPVGFQRQQLRPVPPRERSGQDARMSAAAFAYSQQPVELKIVVDPPTNLPQAVEVIPRLSLAFQPDQTLLLNAHWEIQRMQRGEVDQLEIQWPADWSFEPTAKSGISVSEPVGGVVRIRFDPPLSGPAELRFTGRRRLDQAMQIDLPYAVAAANGKGKCLLVHQTGELRLQPGGMSVWLKGQNSGLTLGRTAAEDEVPLIASTAFPLPPPSVQVPWRMALECQPRRHEYKTHAEVFLTPREMQIRQVIAIRLLKDPPAKAPPASLVLLVPVELEAFLDARLVAVKGDKRYEGPITLQERPIASREGYVERELTLPGGVEPFMRFELWLSSRLPLSDRAAMNGVSIKLVQLGPDFSMAGQAEARVWTTSGVRAELADSSGWRANAPAELEAYAVPPSLSARTRDAGQDLDLRIERANEPFVAELTADRIWIDASRSDDGRWNYRWRCRFTNVKTDAIRLTLPAGARSLDRIWLDGVELPASRQSQAEGDSGPMRIAIALEPRMMARAVTLELHFRVPASTRWANVVQSLPAPQLESRAAIEQVRWRVDTPEDRLLLAASADPTGASGYRWRSLPWPGLRWVGYVVAPQPSLAGAGWEEDALEGDDGRTALRFTHYGSMEPLQLVTVHRLGWLFACSLAVLGIGIGWYCYPPRHPLFWLALMLVAVSIVGLTAPSVLLAVLFGMQPGAAVLALCMALLWLRQLRWRRQMVLMPGFQRLVGGSTLVRKPLIRPRPDSRGPPALPESVSAGQAP